MGSAVVRGFALPLVLPRYFWSLLRLTLDSCFVTIVVATVAIAESIYLRLILTNGLICYYPRLHVCFCCRSHN